MYPYTVSTKIYHLSQQSRQEDSINLFIFGVVIDSKISKSRKENPQNLFAFILSINVAPGKSKHTQEQKPQSRFHNDFEYGSSIFYLFRI